ncbi:MAG: hypothetical protein K2X87_08060 [Gemmataceae bacterium]|nr:hypothetical protein [Gemmataceae bacterium]
MGDAASEGLWSGGAGRVCSGGGEPGLGRRGDGGETAVRHFVADVRELLSRTVKLGPVQEKARDELLRAVGALLTRPA